MDAIITINEAYRLSLLRSSGVEPKARKNPLHPKNSPVFATQQRKHRSNFSRRA